MAETVKEAPKPAAKEAPVPEPMPDFVYSNGRRIVIRPADSMKNKG